MTLNKTLGEGPAWVSLPDRPSYLRDISPEYWEDLYRGFG